MTAAAAAIAGLTRCVRPPAPCRPTKLRLEVEAQRSLGFSMSGFNPMHMEQPASRRLLGVAVVIVIGLLADLLPSGPAPTHLLFGDQHVFIPTVWDILAILAIFAVGGFVSRSRFIPVAAVLAILLSLFAQYILYRIALPAGQAPQCNMTHG